MSSCVNEEMTMITRIRQSYVAIALALAIPAIFAQEAPAPQPSATATKMPEAKASETTQPKEESSTTDHIIHLGGQTISYKANASTTLLKNDKDEPVASIFSVAYTRSDIKDLSQRPIAFVYNGGPGASSAWLHVGAFGPRRVVTQNAAPTGPGPYHLIDNGNCLLDKTDLIFIDPVGTGFSRVVAKGDTKDFWGVDQDVKSFADFMGIYISRNGRWNSPKFLIGESYGTFRSVALANYLQSERGIYINGIVLISTGLDFGTIESNLGDDRSYIFHVPSYAAAAWYYKTLKNRPSDLKPLLRDARQWASTDYAAALMKGDTLSDTEKSQIAKRLSDFTGLAEEYILKANLRVKLQQFRAELQRRVGLTVGRYDSRYSAPTYDLLAEYA
jgi:carboxypeptidase C (cathepsin A)